MNKDNIDKKDNITITIEKEFIEQFSNNFIVGIKIDYINVEDQNSKLNDLKTLFNFEPIDIKNNTFNNNVLLNINTYPNIYYFPQRNIKIKSNNIHFNVETLTKNLSFLSSPNKKCFINVNIDGKNNNNKYLKFSKNNTTIKDENNKIIDELKNFYNHQFICKNDGSNLQIEMENIYGNPYEEKNIMEIIAIRPIKDIQLFMLYRPNLIKFNKGKKELYLNVNNDEIVKNNIFYNVPMNSLFLIKYIKNENEIIGINDEVLSILNISKNDIDNYVKNINRNNFKENIDDKFYIIKFLIINNSPYGINYMISSLDMINNNLLNNNKFNDRIFIKDIIKRIILKLRNYSFND